MNIIKGHWGKYAYFAALSIVAALGNMGVVYLINRIINDFFTKAIILPTVYLLYFVASLAVFVVSRWLVSIGIIRFTQGLLQRTRREVLLMILRSSFTALTRNKSRIYTALTRDTDNIVNASINLVDILTNVVIVGICFIYMATLSWKLLLCMLGLIMFTLAIYFFSVKRAEQLFKQALGHNDTFVKYLNEILRGFKEITMEPAKGAEIAGTHIENAISGASTLNQKAQINFLNNRIIGQIAFYVFIGLVMLFLGNMFGISKGVLVNFIFLVLYIWSPIETVVLLIPNLSQASTSLKRLTELENQMTEALPEEAPPIQAIPRFERLNMSNICYEYRPEENNGEPGFGIGPVSFSLEKGEVVFICGGNGSGKTTFINILTGILPHDTGDILVNNRPALSTRTTSYRSLFAPVFSDFHLFDQFYGVQDVDSQKVTTYLQLFEIDNKVKVEDGKFSTVNLSTGQRKRLALICAMIERKPVLILDEFAADQDPHFKRKFYTKIIPFLKNEGFTLVAITHDDNYYQCSDRLYKMDTGRIYDISEEKYSPSWNNISYE